MNRREFIIKTMLLALCNNSFSNIAKSENAQLYKERTESKERLAGALRTRVQQLTKFLKKLKKIRSKLYSHIATRLEPTMSYYLTLYQDPTLQSMV